jgi:hypothetical protein
MDGHAVSVRCAGAENIHQMVDVRCVARVEAVSMSDKDELAARLARRSPATCEDFGGQSYE